MNSEENNKKSQRGLNGFLVFHLPLAAPVEGLGHVEQRRRAGGANARRVAIQNDGHLLVQAELEVLF